MCNREATIVSSVQEEDQVEKEKKRGKGGMTEAYPHQNNAAVGGRRYKETQREKKKREAEGRAETVCLQSADRPEMTHSAQCHC